MYQSTVRKTLLSLIFIVITVIILLPYILKNLGLHPDYEGNTFDLSGKKALIIAQELDLDLVEVSPEANPPVARLMDYGKYKYELAQKAKESKKKQVKISVKEIQLKPKIDTNDFKIKLNRSRKFLTDGDKVKFTIRFRGREAEHPEFGQRILDDYISQLSDIANVESTSKPDGRSITMVLAPSGGKK